MEDRAAALGGQSGNPVERWLFHGTPQEAIQNINRYGFNRSYSGLNGLLIGHFPHTCLCFHFVLLTESNDSFYWQDLLDSPSSILYSLATLYGNGVYFAIQAAPSAQDQFASPNPDGMKHIYYARVLVGDFAQGSQGMLYPPPRNNNRADKYDSVTDNPAGPNMFIIFYNTQAYPDYLIEFK